MFWVYWLNKDEAEMGRQGSRCPQLSWEDSEHGRTVGSSLLGRSGSSALGEAGHGLTWGGRNEQDPLLVGLGLAQPGHCSAACSLLGLPNGDLVVGPVPAAVWVPLQVSHWG